MKIKYTLVRKDDRDISLTMHAEVSDLESKISLREVFNEQVTMDLDEWEIMDREFLVG